MYTASGGWADAGHEPHLSLPECQGMMVGRRKMETAWQEDSGRVQHMKQRGRHLTRGTPIPMPSYWGNAFRSLGGEMGNQRSETAQDRVTQGQLQFGTKTHGRVSFTCKVVSLDCWLGES